jgi:DNA mismatch endonuclease, patch repair protein
MADIFTKEKRSEIMSKIRGKDTKAEIALRRIVSAYCYPLGYRYRKHYRKVPGSPDMAFVGMKIAIFLDGDFWHGYDFENRKRKLPKKYWVAKIGENMRRDRRTDARLRRIGWKPVRFWEHDLKKPEKILRRLEKLFPAC